LKIAFPASGRAEGGGARTLLDLALLRLVHDELLQLLAVALGEFGDVDFWALIHRGGALNFSRGRCGGGRLEDWLRVGGVMGGWAQVMMIQL